jgi:hypothetical protein
VRTRWHASDGRVQVELVLFESEADQSHRYPEVSVSLQDVLDLRASKRQTLATVVRSETEAARFLTTAVRALREHADDALWGGSGLYGDVAAWKSVSSPTSPGWWSAPPYDDPLFLKPRPKAEIDVDREFLPIHWLAHRDLETAWQRAVGFVHRNPHTLQATLLVEDFVYGDGPAFIDRIEDMARSDRRFGDAVADAEIGGMAGPAAERFDRLQIELRRARGRSEG